MSYLDVSKIETYQIGVSPPVAHGSMTAFDPDALYVALDRQRRKSRMRWRDVAAQAGVSPSTLTRIGQGKRPDADGLVRLLGWLGMTDLAPFITPTWRDPAQVCENCAPGYDCSRGIYTPPDTEETPT